MSDKEYTMGGGRVTLTISLKDFLDGIEYDEKYGRNSLINQAAKLLAEEGGDEIRDLIREQVLGQVADLIKEAIEKPVRQTNTWGEPVGEPITLRQLIQQETTDWITKKVPNRGYGTGSSTMLEQFIKEQVGTSMKREMAKSLEAAKAQVQAAVTKQGAEVIAETIKKMGGA